MIKVLFLSQWYPNRLDKMFGLFVQKHAEAVSLYCDVKVLYVHADENIDCFEIITNKRKNITEVIVYFPCKKNCSLYKSIKVINYIRAYCKGYKLITEDGFRPDIVHANILTRTGLIAYLIKVLKGIPYIITEHWSRYLPARNSYTGTLRKVLTQFVVKRAEAILPVSLNLKNAMLDHNLKNKNYVIVNNVVDNCFFNEQTIAVHPKKRIIHISCFDNEAKNVTGIVRVAFELSKIRNDFEFLIIGNGIDFEKTVSYADTLHFEPGVLNFMGEKTSEEVAYWLNNSDLFVLFSNYETAGVVIAESLVCGKPVVSTKVGATPEYINKNNGIIIDIGDEIALKASIDYMLEHINEYNSKEIKAEANNKFSYKSVGNHLFEIYKKVLGES